MGGRGVVTVWFTERRGEGGGPERQDGVEKKALLCPIFFGDVEVGSLFTGGRDPPPCTMWA